MGLFGGGPATDPARAQGLARVVFAVLVLACFGAFALTQRLKHTPTAVQNFEMNPSFQPTRRAAAACRGRVPTALVGASGRLEYLSFKLAHADAVTAVIVDAAGDQVATVVDDLRVPSYKQVSLCWNGQRGALQRGGVAPPGEYRLLVRLREQRRAVYSPNSFYLRGGRS